MVTKTAKKGKRKTDAQTDARSLARQLVLRKANMKIGQRMRDRRLVMGLTQDQLADRCDVSSATIAHWESGRGLPPAGHFPVVAVQLNTTCNYLLTGNA
jgi:DNA-binding transcriptional regulator YiaG